MSAREIAQAGADGFDSFHAYSPVKRLSVSEGAAEVLHIRHPGGYSGPWSASETPYMVEPMDMLASREHEAVVFVGPARTGKTMALCDGFIAHAMVNDPGDMLVVHMTQKTARAYSQTRVARAIRHSPKLQALISASDNEDNTYDKVFRHGAVLRLGWPSATQLSGADYRYVVQTDYDRVPDDIDGEGAMFPLGLKRTQTFLSRGMCVVESSPGRDITDPNWVQATPHEAPPCGGILSIYNNSNRKRWYWPCPHCGEYTQATPGISGLFNLPRDDELLANIRDLNIEDLAEKHSMLMCSACGALIEPKHKDRMNQRGRWASEWQHVTPDGTVVGKTPATPIAGYWLGGVAAAYQSWHSLVLRHLQGLRELATTGQEKSLQTTTNTDQGMPYMPRALLEAGKGLKGPQARVEPGLDRFIVPDNARFLVAAVDVQAGQRARFEVQVHAVGLGFEQWPIDRYSIVLSSREGVDGDLAPIDPASYPEDWDQLTNLVVNSTYRTTTEGRELRIRLVVCDTGGEAGVTDKAYAWYRRLRAAGLHSRVMLLKGASTLNAPLVKESFVGATRTGEKGDIPLYLWNTNLLKDAVDGAIRRADVGLGYFHIPKWLPKAFFEELSSEFRGPNGAWRKVHKRNESLDLCAYIRAGVIRLGADRFPHGNDAVLPSWAQPLDRNSDIITSTTRRSEQQRAVPTVAPGAFRRQITRSAYLS